VFACKLTNWNSRAILFKCPETSVLVAICLRNKREKRTYRRCLGHSRHPGGTRPQSGHGGG
jgi:hypothetical protein